MKILLFIGILVILLLVISRLSRSARQGPGKRSGGDHRQNAATSGMPHDEACAVLGLENSSLTRESVIDAHRRLMQHVHPDKGGSALLAQQLNEAKRVLLSGL